MNDNQKEVFLNRAYPENSEHIACDECFQPIVFHLKDSNDNEFSLGLISVLEMLEFAVKEGVLPKLPISWCSKVEEVLRVGFDDDATYYDYENFINKKD